MRHCPSSFLKHPIANQSRIPGSQSPGSFAVIDNLLLLASSPARWARQCNTNSPRVILFNSHRSPESSFYRKRNWGLEIGILAMLCLLNSLETLNILKNLFSRRGTKISLQLESLPLRERGLSLFLCFSLPPFPVSRVLKICVCGQLSL